MLHDFLHGLFARRHVLARIVGIRILLEESLDGVRERDLQIRCDVDLADAQRDGLRDELIRHIGCTVENQRNVYLAANLLQTVEVQMRTALVQAMRRADGDGEAVDARLRHVADGIVRIRVGTLGIGDLNVILTTDELAQLCLDRSAAGMGELDDLPDLGHILLVGQAGSIDHDASAAGGNRRLYLVDILMMIQMEGHRDVVLLHGRTDERDEVIFVGVYSTVDGVAAMMTGERISAAVVTTTCSVSRLWILNAGTA